MTLVCREGTLRLLTLLAWACVGGALGWPSAALTHERATTATAFEREIVPILKNRCVSCHAPDAVAFPLTTYQETKAHARLIKAAVLRRQMPPWPGVPGYGTFVNANGLTRREIDLLVSWIDSGAPRSLDARVQSPTTPVALETLVRGGRRDWTLGTPTLSVEIPAATVGGGEAADISRAVVDPGLKSEAWVTRLEYLPADRHLVRAAYFTVEETGQWIGSWTPWYGVTRLPQGVAYRLGPGSRIGVEIHYRALDGEAGAARGRLGVFLTDKPQPHVPLDLVVQTTGPSRLAGRVTLKTDTYLLSLRPEAGGDLGVLEVSARKPDGTTEVLLLARDVKTAWPTPYIFEHPIYLPKGTVVLVNSEASTPHAKPLRLTLSHYTARR